ncbi:MAG: outer membrane protein transport protein [Bacteroidales bacterium]
MKKFNSILAALLVTLSANAEGYQVNSLSASQVGMAHVGTGMKLGAESMHFNPAGMAFMEDKLDFSIGASAVVPSATCTYSGTEYSNNSTVSTPLYAYGAFSVNDKIKVGISLTTPYGSSIDWGSNWAGAVLSQNVSLQAFSLQPTIAWKITDKLSIGAGAIISWGSVELEKGLVSASSMNMVLAAQGSEYSFGDTTPASVQLSGSSKVSVGYNVGAMYDITDKLTVGASFRSEMGLKVEAGDAKLIYAKDNDMAQLLLGTTLDAMDNSQFEAEMPMPYNLTLGTSYQLTSRLLLAFDAQLTGWSAYDVLNINFLGDELTAYNQSLEKNYSNSWAFRIGAEYALNKSIDLRAGFYYDQSPVNSEYYNPETPSMDKISPSFGFSYRPTANISIDVACAYIHGLGADDASYTYTDTLLETETTFTANYSVSAWNPTLGISYSF